MFVFLLFALLSCIQADDRLHCTGDCQKADPAAKMSKTMMHKEHFWTKCVEEGRCPNNKAVNTQAAQCVNGFAGEYPCCNVDLLAFIDIKSLGAGGDGNDIWGWTDPVTGHEIAIAAMYDGTSFVDVTNPTQPSVLGFLPTHTTGTFWRDVKVFANHAYIVSEAYGHGLQVFDLTTLRDAPRNHIFSGNVSAVPRLKETVWYGEFGSAHNLVINEESGYLYSVGSKTCNSGLHIVDIRVAQDPKFVGCYAEDGYVHDAQCVNYDGPDKIHFGKEICFCYDEDTLTIVDVTNKAKPKTISRTPYALSQYTHQGWLLPGSKYLLLDDELDELLGPYPNTRTMLWDVQTLASPQLVRSFCSSETVIDHNLYTLGGKAYQANYCGGLRILDTNEAQTKGGELREIGYFDVAPDCSTTEFLGSWSVYPYFKSGTIVVNSIDRGLFVLAENGNKQCETKPPPRCS